jgi:D-alanyl-D-alanine carboxypeptidase
MKDSLQQVLDNKLVELELYGIQAALRSGDFYWQGESGFADSAQEIELKQNQIMRVGSVTKFFTAPLILKLAEEGEFDLDDKLSDWFPKYPQAEQITIRQLLNHSSGIYNYTENLWLSLETALRPKKRNIY